MADAKTAAELQADADKKREEEDRLQQQQFGWFDRLSNMLPDFDLGSLLMWGLVLMAAYTFGKSPKGQEFIEDVTKRFEPETQLKINVLLNSFGLGEDIGTTLTAMPLESAKDALAEQVPAEALRVMAKNKPTLDMLVKTAQDANGGRAYKDDFVNDKTLFALMTQQPAFVRELAASTLKSSSPSTGAMAQQILASLTTIVADEARLGTLLNPPHRDNTVALIQQLSPKISTASLHALIDTGLKEGTPTPAFRTLLGEMLTEGSSPESALANYVKATPAAASITLKLIESQAPTVPAVQPATATESTPSTESLSGEQLFSALQNNNHGNAYAAFKTALGEEKTVEFLMLAKEKSSNPLPFEQFSLTHREALAAFLEASDAKALPPEIRDQVTDLLTLPAAATPILSRIVGNGVDLETLKAVLPSGNNGQPIEAKQLVEKMFNNSDRATLERAGADNVAALVQAMASTPQEKHSAEMITPHSLQTVLTAADAIAGNPAMRDKNTARDTQLVTTALVELLVNDNHAPIAKVKPENFAAFFDDATNANAIEQLMRESKTALPQGQQATITALLNHWQMVQQVASDKEAGAAFIRDQLASPTTTPTAESCAPAGNGYLDLAKQLLADKAADVYLRTHAGLVGNNIIGHYAEELKTLKTEMDTANCANLTLPAKPALIAHR